MLLKPSQLRLLILLFASSAPSPSRAAPAQNSKRAASSTSAASAANAPEVSATAARAVTRAHAERDSAQSTLERLAPLVAQRKELSQRVSTQSKEFKRHSSAGLQAEKAQQAMLKNKNADQEAAELFALAVYHYDEAGKLAETLAASNAELRKVERELMARITALSALANRAVAQQKELSASLKDLNPGDRAPLKASVDDLSKSVTAIKKASTDAQARVALGSPESDAAQKSKRDAADAKLQAELNQARADQARGFATVHAARAPGCNLRQVDFKNRDYEGMSFGGRPMPFRDGQVPESELETHFGIPWIITRVSFVHLAKDGSEQAVVGFSNQSADGPAGASLVFDLGSECLVRYRGSSRSFLSECEGQHCYVSSPHTFLPGGGTEGCDAAELTIVNDKVVERYLPKPPPGVCD